MDRDIPEHLPANDPESADRGKSKSREIEDVPEPGTDPLHEGP